MEAKRLTVSSAAGVGTLLPLLHVDHTGVGGVVAFGVGALVYYFYDDIFSSKQQKSDSASPLPAPVVVEEKPVKPSKLPRFIQVGLHGKDWVKEREDRLQPQGGGQDKGAGSTLDEPNDLDDLDDLEKPREKSNKPFLFSEILKLGFKPSLDKIYLATRPDGYHIFCNYKALCHVALAGATDGGKSNIMRMLVIQLCSIGAKVLVLNPHWTGYVLDKQEDWTPIIPFLFDDPMDCRKYDKIDYYLKYLACKTIPNRLERFANSKPVGKPIFVVLDELPAIVKRVKQTPEYLDTILKEGRKVNVFLISAAQDFLVNTLGGTGEVRDCYRTAYSVGAGDTTTKKLLGRTDSEMTLGKGVVLLRNASSEVCKEAITALVPYVDNESLYTLLGPSTYEPYDAADCDTDDLEDAELEDARIRMQNGLRLAPGTEAAAAAATAAVKKEPKTAQNDEVPAAAAMILPDGWTEEEAAFARWSYGRSGSKEKVLAALGKKGANDRLRTELDQVLQGGN